MTYAYQWQRCNTTGGSCAAISGATAGSYALVAADVGSTLRASVTVSNAAGSATASSDPTAVVGGLPSSNPYYTEHFDNAYNNGVWSDNAGGVNTFIAGGWLNQGRRVTDCASPSATQHCSGSLSNYGQNGGLNAVSLPNNDRPHTGRIPGSGSNCCDGNGAGGVSTWYRFHVRFPTGYQPTPGTQYYLGSSCRRNVRESGYGLFDSDRSSRPGNRLLWLPAVLRSRRNAAEVLLPGAGGIA
jgi:hypothetical protein